MKLLRCAVYTRKSTEDGLEQEFNSLDAQREACEVYVLSQRHEGWSLVPTRYDDGGFSGGNMERPGLKALLADVDAGLVNVIVVYKVDRLTRSLADFAKIVERLDAREASFVSITQAFNTTTSMGRLTLNVLLSFAQFEREVTGERIRDKIAASKKKGMWMGGPVPLGYQVAERKLVPVPAEAESVRTIMRRYIASSSANALIAALKAEGIVTKVQQRTSGPHRGGIPFRRGSLFHLLKNPIYRGKIVYKGQVYDGEHQPIVDEALWQAVQAQLSAKAPPRRRATNERQPGLLVGMLRDPEGRPMVPTFGCKGTRRYAYYESRKDLARPGDPPATRFSQGVLDRHVTATLASLLQDQHALRRVAGTSDAAQLSAVFEHAQGINKDVANIDQVQLAISSVITSVQVQKTELQIALNPAAFGIADQPSWTWSIPHPLRKPFREAKLKLDAPGGPHADPQLLSLVADAFKVQRLVLGAPDLSVNQLASRERRCRKQMAKLLRLSWASPRIIDAIASGTQPKGMNRTRLLETDLPLGWHEQEAMLGFTA